MRRLPLSEFKVMNSSEIERIKESVIICYNSEPISVLIPYKDFLKMQELERIMREI